MDLAFESIYSFEKSFCFSNVRDMSSVHWIFYLRTQIYLENTALFYGDRRVSKLYIFHLSKQFLPVFFSEVGFKFTVKQSVSLDSSKSTVKNCFPWLKPADARAFS